jgi:hypothetical protein
MSIDWNTAYSPAQAKMPQGVKREQKFDETVSQIVGKPVLANDPRLIRLVVKWKNNTGNSVDTDVSDDFLQRPECLAELKEVFNG